MAKARKSAELSVAAHKAFHEFLKEFTAEGDRAAVILGVARLDSLLLQLLSRVLVPNTGNTDELLEGDAPLGTFHARIHCAYRLALIDAELARALHICRRIRNTFAHELSGSTLDSGSHRDRVRELTAPFIGYKMYEEFERLAFTGSKGTASDFRCALAVISVRLEGALANAKPFDRNSPFRLLIPNDEWDEPGSEQSQSDVE